MSGIDIVVQVDRFAAMPYWQAMASVGVPPHVSILYPWRESPLSSVDIADARRVIGSTRAFSIDFEDAARFENGTVYARVKENPALSRLMKTVWVGFPETPPYGGEFQAPEPHLTLAKPVMAEADDVLVELQAQLSTHLPLRFYVERISVLEQSRDDTWRAAAAIGLQRE